MPAPLPQPLRGPELDAAGRFDTDRVFDELMALRIAQTRVEAKLEELSVSQHDVGLDVADVKELLRSAGSAAMAAHGPSRQATPQHSPRFRTKSFSTESERDGPGMPDFSPLARSGISGRTLLTSERDPCEGVLMRRQMSDGEQAIKAGGASEGLVSMPETRSELAFVASTLPLGWPGVLRTRVDILPAFDISSIPMGARGSLVGAALDKKMASFSTKRSHGTSTVETVMSSREQWTKTAWFTRRCVIDPNSRFHMIFSMLSLLILVYDLTLLPYVLAWDVEFTGALYVSSWVTPIFWTCDIGINFLTGFYRGGELVKDLRMIRRSYFRTWFWPDACVVACDWISVILAKTADGLSSNSSRSLKMLRFTKLGRALRIMGMMRMLRVVRILEELADLYLTEGYRLGFRMFNLFTGILWVAHMLACIWYGVGKAAPTDTGAHWVDTAYVWVDGAQVRYTDTGALYQYMVAFHWAAAQIALGGIDVFPVNSWERWVYICAMMCGFLFGSTLVSTLSAAMMEYQMMQKETTMKLRLLRKYLRENNVEPQVAVPVQKQVEQRLNERDALSEGDVEALRLLSTALRSQLRFEIQRACLTRHPLFRLWTSLDIRWMQRTCMQAVSFVSLRPKDELFSPGSTATVAHALDSGELIYVQRPDSAPVESDTRKIVRSGQWLCEAALWVEWTRVGKAEAETNCALLEVAAEPLFNCFPMELTIRDIALEYCEQFHKRVLSAHPPQAPWPTDLEVPFTDYCDLVVSMNPQIQVMIGREALCALFEKGGKTAKKLEKLAQEVEASKSIVVALDGGSIIRVASLVVLRVEDAFGRIFVQVGKWDGKKIKGTCQLPGVKQERDELVSQTADRLFDTRLMPFSGKLDFHGFTRENTESMSKEFGVQTRYIRSICTAKLRENESFQAPVCKRAGFDAEVTQAFSDRRSEEVEDGGNVDNLDEKSQRLLMGVQSTQVFAIFSKDGRAALYAWLKQDTINALTGSGGDKVLSLWMARLALPRECTDEFTCDDIAIETAAGGRFQPSAATTLS
mmetsp:Transcript_6973/g.19731  ORF Transcript_6973/g.19731 Transcript_6973/m.19731 type:complete len:1033 (+) Transcript_6973:80-3178(+)